MHKFTIILFWLCTLLITSCSKKDPEPAGLEKAVGSKELSDYLHGEWHYNFPFYSGGALSEKLIFDRDSNVAKIETIITSTYLGGSADNRDFAVTNKGDVITLTYHTGEAKSFTIEQKSQSNMIMHEVGSPVNDLGKSYTRSK